VLERLASLQRPPGSGGEHQAAEILAGEFEARGARAWIERGKATTVARTPSAGIATSVWVCLGIAAGGGLFATCVTVIGRARLQRPDLERWEQGDEPAWDSPPLAAAIRGRAVDARRWKPRSRKPLRR
jgi:hypothetical protein